MNCYLNILVFHFPGPFTLFAPTDKGFDELPADVLEKLSKDKALLKEVLSFHVASGQKMSTDLKNDELLDSLDNPQKLRINIYDQVSFFVVAISLHSFLCFELENVICRKNKHSQNLFFNKAL